MQAGCLAMRCVVDQGSVLLVEFLLVVSSGEWLLGGVPNR
jgi:hypothetical protein